MAELQPRRKSEFRTIPCGGLDAMGQRPDEAGMATYDVPEVQRHDEMHGVSEDSLKRRRIDANAEGHMGPHATC